MGAEYNVDELRTPAQLQRPPLHDSTYVKQTGHPQDRRRASAQGGGQPRQLLMTRGFSLRRDDVRRLIVMTIEEF